ncbi:hypothetical protein BaRGS_00008342, partial [Batillaria attramentaria]
WDAIYRSTSPFNATGRGHTSRPEADLDRMSNLTTHLVSEAGCYSKFGAALVTLRETRPSTGGILVHPRGLRNLGFVNLSYAVFSFTSCWCNRDIRDVRVPQCEGLTEQLEGGKTVMTTQRTSFCHCRCVSSGTLIVHIVSLRGASVPALQCRGQLHYDQLYQYRNEAGSTVLYSKSQHVLVARTSAVIVKTVTEAPLVHPSPEYARVTRPISVLPRWFDSRVTGAVLSSPVFPRPGTSSLHPWHRVTTVVSIPGPQQQSSM